MLPGALDCIEYSSKRAGMNREEVVMMIRHTSKSVRTALLVAFGVAVVCFLFSGTALAQSANKKTTVIFKTPVEIPGVGAQVLPPGTYVFRLLDSIGDRHIVNVFNENESHVFASIVAIPNYRLKATNKTVLMFSERVAGEPLAIKAWFYPGDNWGHEFAYPKKKALELALATMTPVPYIPDELAANIVASAETAGEAPVVALKEAPVRAIGPTGVEVELGEIIVPPPVNAGPSLPKTAGYLPLVALMGVVCLGIGITLRASCAR